KVAQIARRERGKPVRLSERAYLAATRRGVVPCLGHAARPDLEGFLFPATYDFLARTTARLLVRAQLAAFCRTWRGVDLSYARSKNLTPYDVLKVASMVEAEAAVPADRPKIAAVIYNRLRERMPLQIDATLRYGLHIPPTRSITQSELASANPYNTRKLYGLPPTPIGNPGLASIRAAAHPSRLGYLYYARVPNTDRHVFFESYTAYERYLAAHGYGPDRRRSSPCSATRSRTRSRRACSTPHSRRSGSIGTTRPSTSRTSSPPSPTCGRAASPART